MSGAAKVSVCWCRSAVVSENGPLTPLAKSPLCGVPGLAGRVGGFAVRGLKKFPDNAAAPLPLVFLTLLAHAIDVSSNHFIFGETYE
jgi:hypothetical protein